jgi:hypothetical protein
MKIIDNIKKYFFPDPPHVFEAGDSVTPKERHSWLRLDDKLKHTGQIGSGPAFGEIVKVITHLKCTKLGWQMRINKYPGNFFEKDFYPVISTSELCEVLEEAKIPIEKVF